MALNIDYNRKRDLAFVTDDPYTFLVMDSLFDGVTYITDSKQDWLKHLDVAGTVKYFATGKAKKSDVARLLRNKKVVEYISSRPNMKIDLYSPIDPPYKINPLSLLMNSPAIAHAYENKRYFRDEFADIIRMPKYEIKYLSELDKAAAYRDLSEELGTTKLVLQDEQSSGSKGTFIVANTDEYIEAVQTLKKESSGNSIVVSEFIDGEVAGIQACITKHGTFTSGLQLQLVDVPDLCNPKLTGTTRWCGGVLGAESSEYVFHQSREIATVVGSELAAHGYKGIFGVDLIVTPQNEVYAIEINARHTGYSALISDVQLNSGKIPFMLLHMLELANENYQITDIDALPSYTPLVSQSYTYLVMINPVDGDIEIKKDIIPGVYEVTDDGLKFVKPGYSVDMLKKRNQILVLSRRGKGDVVKRGLRILKVIAKGNLRSTNTELSPKGKRITELVKKHWDLDF